MEPIVKLEIPKIKALGLKNIGIRNLADIALTDIDVYGTGKRKKTIFKFEGTIQFFRSIPQSQGKLGKEDTSYTGQFGFDLYNKEHCPKGGVIYYLDKDGKTIEDKNYSAYVSSYLSIWPPKVDKEKSSVILYAKANDNSSAPELLEYEYKEWNKESKNFSTPSTKLSITKLNTQNVGGENYYKINVQCIGSFENDISIIAKHYGNVVGRIIVKANAKVYETFIQPILIKFGTAASNSIEVLNKHDEFIENTFLPFFQKNSFNQSYIKGKLAEKTKSVTFSKDEFLTKKILYNQGKNIYLDRVQKTNYNKLVEERFAAYNTGAQEKQSIKEDLIDTAFELLKAFKENFKYSDSNDLKKAKKFYEEKKATTAWNNIKVQTAYTKYKSLKEKYKGDNFVDKKNTTYLFYSYDLEACKYENSEDKVRAFSQTGGGTVHIFNYALTANEIAEKTKIEDDKSEALIVHELGHAYGLSHTMDDKSAEKIESYKTEIDSLEKVVEKYRKLKQSDKEYEKYIRLDLVYINIKDMLKKEKSEIDIESFESMFLVKFITDINDKCWYFENNERKNIFDTIVLKMEENIDTLPVILYDTTETKEEKEEREKKYEKITFDYFIRDNQNRINHLKKEITKQEKTLGMIAEQTETLENFMDYSQNKGIPTQEDRKNPHNLNEKFSHKTFYQWQWNIMMGTGRKKYYLSEIITLNES